MASGSKRLPSSPARRAASASRRRRASWTTAGRSRCWISWATRCAPPSRPWTAPRPPWRSRPMSPTRRRFRPPCEQAQRQFGRIDALVNNAGIAVFKPMLDVTLEEWQRVLAVNLTGPFLMTQAVAPIMRDQGGGAIVNITSISGLRASTLRVAYGTSKAGLAHLTRQQAAELGAVRHPRQRRGAGTGRYRHGQGRPHPGDPRRLSRPYPAQPLRPGERSSPTRSASCAATRRATSPARCWRWMAASTPPASACRRCGANGGISEYYSPEKVDISAGFGLYFCQAGASFDLGRRPFHSGKTCLRPPAGSR